MAARDEGVSRAICAVILAAGEGTRMRSERPKPLHLICGRPMASYVLDAVGEQASIGQSGQRVGERILLGLLEDHRIVDDRASLLADAFEQAAMILAVEAGLDVIDRERADQPVADQERADERQSRHCRHQHALR